MAVLRLGNLTLNELTKRLGIELTEEHKAFLEASRVDKVSDSYVKNYKIAPDTWHAFDLPSPSTNNVKTLNSMMKWKAKCLSSKGEISSLDIFKK